MKLKNSRSIDSLGKTKVEVLHEDLAVCNVINDIIYYDYHCYNTRNLKKILELLSNKLSCSNIRIIKTISSYYETILYNKVMHYNLQGLMDYVKYHRDLHFGIKFSDYGTKDDVIPFMFKEIFGRLYIAQGYNNIIFELKSIYTNCKFAIDDVYNIVKYFKFLIILRSMEYYAVTGRCNVINQQDRNHVIYIHKLKSALTQMLNSLAFISFYDGMDISDVFIINNSFYRYQTTYDFSNFITDTYQDFDICQNLLLDINNTGINMLSEKMSEYDINNREYLEKYDDINNRLCKLYNYPDLYDYEYWYEILENQLRYINNELGRLDNLRINALYKIDEMLNEKSYVESLIQ